MNLASLKIELMGSNGGTWGALETPYLKMIGFGDLSRFHQLFVGKTWEKPIVWDPHKVQKYSKIVDRFSKIVLL